MILRIGIALIALALIGCASAPTCLSATTRATGAGYSSYRVNDTLVSIMPLVYTTSVVGLDWQTKDVPGVWVCRDRSLYRGRAK